MSILPKEAGLLGVGIDTARYGHRVTFLDVHKQPAAAALDVRESAAGYAQLRQALEQLAERHPGATFHVRIDAAGQYAVNLEQFLRSLPLPLEISLGEPARNAAYRKAHFPKRKSDRSDSLAQARYAVVERPAGAPATPREFLALREVASRLESQVKQTTRGINQLHNLLARVFPELAALAPDLKSAWVLKLLSRYPTPERLARARPSSLAAIRYLKSEQAAALQQAARGSVGALRGEVAETLVRQTLREIELSRDVEKHLQKLLQTTFDALPDGPHRRLTTIPGIGTATAAAIVAKVVSIERFDTPAQLVGFFGAFPQESSSGYDREGRPVPPGAMAMSKQGNDLVRRCLWMAAQAATLHNPAIRALYRRQKSRGKRGDVALGHCMRKLLHLVFAVWKTDQPFNPRHYPWEQPAPDAGGAEKKRAAGHKEDEPRDRKVVAAAPCKVESPPASVNVPKTPASRRAGIDYPALRRQVTMEQVLSQLGWLRHLKGRGAQRRGPCPIHGQAEDRHRSFSVALDKQAFQCFHPSCAAQGNPLDLWAAVHRLPLHAAALHLAETFHLLPPPTREEEPVRPTKNHRPHQPKPLPAPGVITPDAT
jgi:transposase